MRCSCLVLLSFHTMSSDTLKTKTASLLCLNQDRRFLGLLPTKVYDHKYMQKLHLTRKVKICSYVVLSYEGSIMPNILRIWSNTFLIVTELIRVIEGVSIYSQDCFEDRYCFSLIFNQGSVGSNLTNAQDSCRNIRSKLAEISDNQTQNYTNEFMKNAISFIASNVQKNVLINAQLYDNGTWFWVNGELLG